MAPLPNKDAPGRLLGVCVWLLGQQVPNFLALSVLTKVFPKTEGGTGLSLQTQPPTGQGSRFGAPGALWTPPTPTPPSQQANNATAGG